MAFWLGVIRVSMGCCKCTSAGGLWGVGIEELPILFLKLYDEMPKNTKF